MWNHAQISFWNQPVLGNKGRVSCSKKQRGHLIGFEPTTKLLRVMRATHYERRSTYARLHVLEQVHNLEQTNELHNNINLPDTMKTHLCNKDSKFNYLPYFLVYVICNWSLASVILTSLSVGSSLNIESRGTEMCYSELCRCRHIMSTVSVYKFGIVKKYLPSWSLW